MKRVFPVLLLVLLTGCTMRERYDRRWIEESYATPPQPTAPMLSNQDIIQLTTSGMSEEVIVQSIRTTPAQFDVGPMGLMTLKQSGVSDLVIQEMQRKSTIAAVPPPPQTVIVQEERPPVLLLSTPHCCPPHFCAPPRHRFRHHHHGHGPHTGISISAEF